MDDPNGRNPQNRRILTYGSLFSGIEGFGLGFEQAGFEIRWQVEQEEFCNKILRTHWPNVKRYRDVRKVGKRNLENVDCITAGVPCQDVSVAGKRAGLAGKRTGLFYEFARVLQELRPAWFVFENVPGLFSSNEGRDFAEVLRVLMVECDYGISGRVLDSRYFNVAQRREREFIVGCLGKPCPPEILFESEGGSGDPPPGGESRQDIAIPLTSGSHKSCPGRRLEDDYNIVATTLSAEYSEKAYRGDGSENIIAIQDVRGGTRDKTDHGQGIGISESGPMYTLSKTEQHAVAFAENQRGEIRLSGIAPQLSTGGGKPGSGYSAVFESRFVRNGRGRPSQIVPPLKAQSGSTGKGDSAPLIAGTFGSTDGGFRTTDLDGSGAFICAEIDTDGVRDFAGLPKGMDSPRYRALGNAVTTTVSFWIAQRIMRYEEIHR